MRFSFNYRQGIFLLFLLLTIISGATLIQNVDLNHQIDQSALSTSAPEDFYEPNNNPASAYDLTMFELTWLSWINGPGTQWDDDWYKIVITPGYERLIVKLIFSHMEGDIDIEVYNNTLSLMTGSYSVEDGEFIDIILPSGQYYLKVYYGNAGNHYDLLWDARNPILTDDNYEENDDRASASLSANQGMWLSQINDLGVQADDDWYEIYINPGYERLIVQCIFSNDSGNIDMDIYYYNGSLFMVGNSWTEQNYEVLDFIVPSSGVYYIRLHYGNGGNTYDLRWDSLIPDDVYEENDFDWDAYDLSPWPASWLPFGPGIQADDDWYMVYLDPGEERISVQLSFSHALGNINMEVWYWDGGVFKILVGSYTTDDNEYIDANAPWPGTYYIKVFGDNTGNNYDLLWEDLSPGGPGDDPMEENDDFWSAAWITGGWYSDLRIIHDDEDWFQIYVNPGDVIEAIIFFKHKEGDLQLELYDPSYIQRAGSYSSPNSRDDWDEDKEIVTYMVDVPGNWRIRVYHEDGDTDVHYNLVISIKDDFYELNNDFYESYFLGEDERTWLSDIYGLAAQGDFDYYLIDVTPGFERLVVDLRFNHSLGNIDLSIYEVDFYLNMFYLINGSYSTTDNEYIDYPVPHPGPYIILVHGDNMRNKYNLWWDDLRTDFRPDDNYEPNNDPMSAYDLSFYEGMSLGGVNGLGLQYDNDWYKIYVNSDRLRLNIRLFYDYAEGAVGIQIYDWDLHLVTGNFTMSDNEMIDYVLPSNGTYYIRIYGDHSGNVYDLWWETWEHTEGMIPGYDIFILLIAIFGVVTVITIKSKRSKNNL